MKSLRLRSPISLAKLLMTVSALLVITLAIAMAFRAHRSYQESIVQGKENAQRLVHMIADHVSLTFLSVDLTLKKAIERKHFTALFGNTLSGDMQNNLTAWGSEIPHITVLLTTNEHGVIQEVYTKQSFRSLFNKGKSIAEKNYFKVHQEDEVIENLYIAPEALLSPTDNFTILSRRITKLDGSFGGIVMAAVNNDYLRGFAESIRGTQRSKIALFYDQSSRVLFNEMEQNEMAWLQRKIQSDNVLSLSPDIVILTDDHEITKDLRVFALKYLPQFNIFLALVSYGDDIYGNWRTDRINDILFLLILSLFAVLATYFTFILSRQVKRVQESEQTAVLASQAKSEFLANMSHELRTPLNAIIGFSEMIEAGYFGSVNAKQKERIQDIASCGTHLLELINDILEFSKAEAGKLELREKRCEIPKIMEDCLRIFRERARIEGKELISVMEPQLPPLMADERKIKQILLNLVSNAVKFTQKGGRIEVSAFLDENRNLHLVVKDNGVGIAEEDITKALSVFGQAHSNVKPGGTGLGLPLSKMLAELHGGQLKLESLKGVGTKVTVTLPAERLPNLAPTPLVADLSS